MKSRINKTQNLWIANNHRFSNAHVHHLLTGFAATSALASDKAITEIACQIEVTPMKLRQRRIKPIALLLLGIAISGTCLAVPKNRDECRASKVQSNVVSCIERGLYDPCDDAGGSWGRAQCGWAWAEIADRRVTEAEREILSRLRKGKAQIDVLRKFRQSQKDWRSYRDAHCSFMNSTVDLEKFKGGAFSHAGFCQRRVTEQRAEELETVIANPE